MSLTELLAHIRALPREEQLQIARTILAECEPEALAYPIGMPFYNWYGAAEVLMKLLEEHRAEECQLSAVVETDHNTDPHHG